jgi:branched-chain amino acid transport system ATP-binding protein
MPLLQLNNVEVKYMDVILVLRGVSLQVEKGSVVALLGNNGAGKTTTLKAISGLLKTEEGKVTDGTIEFEGKRIENGDPEKIARLGIIQVLEGRMVLEHLTVEENLRVGAYIAGNGARLKRDLDMVYGYFPLLKELRGQTSGYLSGGEQQMLVVGRALMPHPKLILLDEASLGLAPLLVEEIFGILKRINEEEKVSMLLVEQNARAALSLAQHGYVMENGRIVLDGTGENLRGNADIREFYMGLGAVGETKSYRDIKHYKRRKRWLD